MIVLLLYFCICSQHVDLLISGVRIHVYLVYSRFRLLRSRHPREHRVSRMTNGNQLRLFDRRTMLILDHNQYQQIRLLSITRFVDRTMTYTICRCQNHLRFHLDYHVLLNNCQILFLTSFSFSYTLSLF